MGTCPTCNMEVADDQMESHAAMHSGSEGGDAPAEGGSEGGDAPAEGGSEGGESAA